MNKPLTVTVVREGRGQYAVVDWSRNPQSPASANTASLHSSRRDAERAARKLAQVQA